jgi:hypothetical protein
MVGGTQNEGAPLQGRAVVNGAASIPAVPASTPSAFPPIEYDDDGYPEDEGFFAFKLLPFDFYAAAQWLIAELPIAAEVMPCFCEVEREAEHFRISFSTGGWSGAESITALIERRIDMSHFMLSWRRGGHYVFEIPHRFLLTDLLAKADQSPKGGDGTAPFTRAAVAESHLPKDSQDTL